MRIGFLNADTLKPEFSAKYGEYPDMFTRCLQAIDPSLEYISFHVQQGVFPEDIDSADAWLLTGSKSSVYDNEPWIHQLADFVRQLHARTKPVIGVCFGHQMVAHALGGEVTKASQGWQVGVKRNQFTAGATLAGIAAQEFRLISSHQDQVVKMASGAELLASAPECPVAMTRLSQHIITVQGHPEFSPSFANDIYTMRREILGETRYQAAVNSLQEPADGEQVLRWALEFVRRGQ